MTDERKPLFASRTSRLGSTAPTAGDLPTYTPAETVRAAMAVDAGAHAATRARLHEAQSATSAVAAVFEPRFSFGDEHRVRDKSQPVRLCLARPNYACAPIARALQLTCVSPNFPPAHIAADLSQLFRR